MHQHVVIGTAGHIDHGKTTLVKALTGVDTDRLAEEKARGITIDIGFAPLDLDGVPASVVDVPGHEAFIRNMLAGTTGIDAALLVVAADEGVMPQTREHLLILRYLGVERGVVALTKCDLVDAAWREMVAEDIRGEGRGERGGGTAWPIIEVSAVTGAGLPALRAALREAALGIGARKPDDRFRMPVDRVFGLAGAGTVVTGTAWSGRVAEGETVTVLPADITARVRSLEVHGKPAQEAAAGRRTALALVGVDRSDLARGSVVVTGDGWRSSSAADVIARFNGAVPRLRARLHAHHGTSEVVGRVARIGEPWAEGTPMRLVFETPLVLRAGDRLVLRSWSPVTTIGGAEVTDPWADQLDRKHRSSVLGPRPSVLDLVARRGAKGMLRAEAEVAGGSSDTAGLAALGDWLVAPGEVESAVVRMMAALEAFHLAQPLAEGMPAQAWRAAAGGPAELAALAEQQLEASGAVVRAGSVVRKAGFAAAASSEARSDMERVFGALTEADAEPPSVAELAASLPGLNVPAILRLLARDVRVILVGDRYYVTDALARERLRLEEALRQLGTASPAEIRGRLGRSRKWLIPLLEWADREGVTLRDGDRRMLNLQAGA